MQVLTIRAVVSCRDRDLNKAAKQAGIDAKEARALRALWTRRLRGEKAYKNEEQSITFLKELSGDEVLFRKDCKDCSRPFSHSAGLVLSIFQKHGAFYPSLYCKNCRRKKAKEKKLPKPLPARASKKKQATKRKPKPKKQQPKKVTPTKTKKKNPDALYHQPFAALEGFNLKKTGPTAG
jgi:hypothetical protein